MIQHALSSASRDCDYRDVDLFVTHKPVDPLHVVDRNKRMPDCLADLLFVVIEQCHNGETRFCETVVICQSCPQSSGSHDSYSMWLVEPENLCQVLTKIADEIADTADTKLTKIAEIFPNLC